MKKLRKMGYEGKKGTEVAAGARGMEDVVSVGKSQGAGGERM